MSGPPSGSQLATENALDEAPAFLSSLEPGARMGNYELLVPLGRGGMAQVWAGRALGGDGDWVAVKTILPAFAGEPRFRKMFQTEARLAACVQHENVCRVLDFGVSGTDLFLAMEWVDGDSLAVLIARAGRLPLGVALRIAHDAALGLQAVHSAHNSSGAPLGIVHRDVSPHNILIRIDGTSKVADFGVAKATQSGTAVTQSEVIKGKVDYLSPEQAFSEPLDARVDVFALGVVLYEMTTGERPFSAGSPMATLVRLTSPEPATPPEDSVPGYPAALSEIVLCALSKDRAQRYSSMADFAAALLELSRQIPFAARAEVAETLARHTGAARATRLSLMARGGAGLTLDAGVGVAQTGTISTIVEHSRSILPSRQQKRPLRPLAFAALGVALLGLLGARVLRDSSVPAADARAPAVAAAQSAPAPTTPASASAPLELPVSVPVVAPALAPSALHADPPKLALRRPPPAKTNAPAPRKPSHEDLILGSRE